MKVLPLALLAIVAFLSSSAFLSQAQSGGIIVTFPILRGDVEKIVGGNIQVSSLVPPGVDPHEYQLSPSDYSTLKSSVLIISTLHTGFEQQIDSMERSGELKAAYIAIPEIPGIKYRIIPNNGIKNPHMPIYDPNNYLLFISNLTGTLDSLYPNMSATFNSNYEKVRSDIEQLISNYEGKLNETAVASVPEVQYAVEWTGIKIIRFLVVDEEVGAQPQDLQIIENSLANGTAKIAVVAGNYDPSSGSWVPDSSYDRSLVDLASKYGAKVVYVPSVSGNMSIADSLHLIVEELYGENSTSQVQGNNSSITTYAVGAAFAIAIAVAGAILYRRGKHEVA